MNRDDFLADPIKVGAAKYYAQAAIECCPDIANHIISSEKLRAPEDYKDTFNVLNEAGILPTDFAATMQDMAGFRNLVVHLYGSVDNAQVWEILQADLGDFDRFVDYVMRFLESTMDQR
ncbi:MAG: DUF86 domain-containing protein [Chloroflexota bacterium]